MTHSPRAVNFSFAVQAFLRSHAACVPKNLLALQNCTQTIRRLVERGRAGGEQPCASSRRVCKPGTEEARPSVPALCRWKPSWQALKIRTEGGERNASDMLIRAEAAGAAITQQEVGAAAASGAQGAANPAEAGFPAALLPTEGRPPRPRPRPQRRSRAGRPSLSCPRCFIHSRFWLLSCPKSPETQCKFCVLC